MVLTRDFFPAERLYNPKAFFTSRGMAGSGCAHCPKFPLLPPVGVWTVSQFQCGWIVLSDQLRSSPW